jgi:hypothetical protein
MLSALVYGSTLLFGSVAKPQPRFDFCSWIELFCHRVSVHGPAHESQRAKPYSIFRFPFHLRTLTAAKSLLVRARCRVWIRAPSRCLWLVRAPKISTQGFLVGVFVPAGPGQIFALDSVLCAGRSLVLSLPLHHFLHLVRVLCSRGQVPGSVSLFPAEATARRFSVRLSVPGSRHVY